jgi:hypothetical protein
MASMAKRRRLRWPKARVMVQMEAGRSFSQTPAADRAGDVRLAPIPSSENFERANSCAGYAFSGLPACPS